MTFFAFLKRQLGQCVDIVPVIPVEKAVMNREEQYNDLRNLFPGLILKDEPMSSHTTLRIGGIADLFCEIQLPSKLIPVLQAARERSVPIFVLGSGSNILIDDAGFRGLIIKFINTDPPRLDFPHVTVPAGSSLKDLLEFAAKNALSGLEFLAGIPGTLGGALYMNAGAYGITIGELFVNAEIIDDDLELKTVDADFFQFRYRKSVLQEKPFTVVSIVLTVNRGDEPSIRAEYNRILSIRAEKHPKHDVPCAGSYFKNLPPENPGRHRRPAGYFLEQAGVKSLSVGGAEVYSGHANIIINTGGATARDVIELARRMKQAVLEKFNIALEEEVKYLDSVKGIGRADG